MNVKKLLNIKEKIIKSKVLIFDFDGVIADSNNVKTEAFASIYMAYGDEVVKKVKDHHLKNEGLSRFEKFKIYHEKFLRQEINQKKIDQLSLLFSKLVFEKVTLANEINSVSKFLKKYGNNYRKCVVNSATPEKELKEIINVRGEDQFFSLILGSPSSKVENIYKILRKYNCENDEVLFFGDSELDLNSAMNTGIDFVGIGSKINKYIRSNSLNYYSINDFKEISEL